MKGGDDNPTEIVGGTRQTSRPFPGGFYPPADLACQKEGTTYPVRWTTSRPFPDGFYPPAALACQKEGATYSVRWTTSRPFQDEFYPSAALTSQKRRGHLSGEMDDFSTLP